MESIEFFYILRFANKYYQRIQKYVKLDMFKGNSVEWFVNQKPSQQKINRS